MQIRPYFNKICNNQEYYKESLKIPQEVTRSRTSKRDRQCSEKMTKKQTMVHKTLHRELKTRQHEL